MLPLALLGFGLSLGTLTLADPGHDGIVPTLWFNVTLRAHDAMQTYSPGDWLMLNMTDGWVANSPAKAVGNYNQSQAWVSGPFCTAVYMEGTFQPRRQVMRPGDRPVDETAVQLSLDTTATISAPSSGGEFDLGVGGKWHYCQPRIDVTGVEFSLHNITITTGLQALASQTSMQISNASPEMSLVPIRTQSLLDSAANLNPFFTTSSANGVVNWDQLEGANVRFDTTNQPVAVSFYTPYSTAFLRLYGSVGPDHQKLNIEFHPPLPGVPAGNLVTADPQRTGADHDRLLFAAPLDPAQKYTVTVQLRQGQVQALSRADFMSGIGIANTWPVEPGTFGDGTEEPQQGLGGHKRLSGGAIAGIVVGVIAGLALLLAIATIIMCRRKTKRNTQRWNDVKLRRVSLSPQVSPPRDIKTPIPGSEPPVHIENVPPRTLAGQRAAERPDEDLNAAPRTPYPWHERPQV